MTVEATTGQPKPFAVVLTSNRTKLLTGSLTTLGFQIRAQDLARVVDNVSTDGSHDLIRGRFPDVDPAGSTPHTGNGDLELTARMVSHCEGTYLPQVILGQQIAELDTKLADGLQRCCRDVGNKSWVLRPGEALARAQAAHHLEVHC